MRAALLLMVLCLAGFACGPLPVVAGEPCDSPGSSTCGPASARYDCRMDGGAPVWVESSCVACKTDGVHLICTPR